MDDTPDTEQHRHAGLSYKLYDKQGATRCEWYSCIYNFYDGDYPDEDSRRFDDISEYQN